MLVSSLDFSSQIVDSQTALKHKINDVRKPSKEQCTVSRRLRESRAVKL